MSGVEIKIVGVLGAGQMGRGIAQVASQSGYQVVLVDISLDAAQAAKSKIEAGLRKLIEKGKLNQEQSQEILSQIKPAGEKKALSEADLIVEAVTENPELKTSIFSELDAISKKSALLTTNTSSVSITKIAAATKRPEKVVGMHFMNPVPVMRLVEGIKGIQTSDETFLAVRKVAEKMGKTFVEARDFPGFVVNRILMPMINEAVYTLYEGVAGAKDIDEAMKLGTNQPMGPLELADFIGLDTCLAIMEVLHEGLGDSKYRPCPLLKNYVAAGWLGKKSGRGFYKYDV